MTTLEKARKRFREAIASGKLKVHPIILVVKKIGGDVPIGYCPRPKDFPTRL